MWSAVVAYLFVAGPALAQSPQDIAKSVFQRTVVLVLEDSAGQAKSLGSGFVVGNGTIATNYHVISGSTRGYAKFFNSPNKIDLEGVLAVDAKRDLALLKASTSNIPPIEMGDSDTVQIGDAVYVAGSPKGLEGTFSNGIVSGVRPLEGDRLIQITAPISPGS